MSTMPPSPRKFLQMKVADLTIFPRVTAEVARQRAADAIRSAPVTWLPDVTDAWATAIVESLFVVGGSFQDPTRHVGSFHLCYIDIVRNMNLASSFASHFRRMKVIRHEDEKFFTHECQCDEQGEVLRILKTLFHPVAHGESGNPRTLTVYHGCRASVARKIVATGFTNWATEDAGYFGHGIHVTPNAEYACEYAMKKAEPFSPEHPDWFSVLLCTAVVGLVYPVTRQVDYTQTPKGHSDLYGKPLKSPYDAHFALVHHKYGYEAAPDPGTAEYGELCVSQYAAFQPLAILWVCKN